MICMKNPLDIVNIQGGVIVKEEADQFTSLAREKISSSCCRLRASSFGGGFV
jgi:hypothetical protein